MAHDAAAEWRTLGLSGRLALLEKAWAGAKQSGFGFHGSPEGHLQFFARLVYYTEILKSR